MGGPIIRVPNLKDQLGDIDRRLRQLEAPGVVSGILALLAHSIGSATFATTSFNPVVIPSSPAAFTLNRDGRILVIATITISITSGGAFAGYVSAFLDGVSMSVNPGATVGNGPTTYYTATIVASPTAIVAKGTHTVDLRAFTDTGQQITTFAPEVWVFQVGSA